MTDNSLANAVYTVGQKMATNLVAKGVSGADADDGLTTLAGKILDIPNKQSTSLTIEVPLNLEYGDNFNIAGVLSKCGGEVISNALIKLLVGSTVVDTSTTDSNGNVSFTQCPVATGTHSFQLVFDGDLNHLNSSSSVVTRDVAKETSVLTVNYPIAGSNHYTDSNVLVAGVLTDNDATPLANRSVKVCDSNDNVLGTLDTEADGSFTGDVTIQNAGAFTLKILHEGNEYYTLACSPREIVMVSPSLSLESDKSIISYNGGTNPESATLTATLHASDVDDKLVTFEVRKQSDDSLVETLSGYTNSSGIASVSYLGKGTGDLYIKANCGIMVSKTYGIEDCKKVFKLDGTEPIGTFNRGSITCSNGILSGKSGYVKGFDNTDSWVLSFDVYHIGYSLLPLVPTTTTSYDSNYVQLMGYVRIFENGRYRDIGYDSGATKKYNEWQNIKIEKENGQYTLYFDDVFVATFTLSWNPSQLGVGFDAWGGSSSGQIKNIKVKPL